MEVEPPGAGRGLGPQLVGVSLSSSLTCDAFRLVGCSLAHLLTAFPLQKSKLETNATFGVEAAEGADRLPPTRPGRCKKPVRYLEESDEDDFF